MRTTKKIIYIYVTMALLTVFVISCSRDVDFGGQLPPNKLVLNCFVDPDSFIVATVSRSWDISEEKGRLMRDAEVSLYINGIFQTIMEPTDSIERSPNEGVSRIITYPTHVSRVKAKEGDLVKIVVKKSGFSDILAETVIPGKAKILSVDTIRTRDQYGSNSLRFLIKFNDLDAGNKNYYRLIVEQFSSLGGIEWQYNTSSSYYDYDQDVALKEGFVNVTDEMFASETRNIYGIFNDETFNGKDYTLNINLQSGYGYYYYTSEGMENPKDGETMYIRYRAKLVTLSESCYLYLKSRTYYDYNGDGDPFAEPHTIFNNVKNGLGIMGGFQVDYKDTDIALGDSRYY